MKNTKMQKELLKREELAAHFQVSRRTVDNWVSLGCPRLILNKEAKRPISRFVAKEVESWLRERTATCQAAGKEVQA